MYSIPRRTVCRLTFVSLGIIPLFVTVVIAGWRNWQYDADHYAALVSRISGFRTTVGDVIFVRPGTVRLEQVSMNDAETGDPFLGLPRVDVRRDNQRVSLVISAAHVYDSAGDRLLHLVHERLLRQPELLSKPIFATFGPIDFGRRQIDMLETGTKGTTRFMESHFELRQIDQGSELRGQLRQTDSSVNHFIELTIRRTLGDLPQSTIALQTHEHWVTANLLVGQQRWLPNLSASARFRGNLHVDIGADGWTGVAFGEFHAIELGQLLGDRFGRFLSGPANAVVRTARFSNSRLQKFDADIDAGPGEFGTRQLKAAADTWQLDWSEPPALDAASMAYDRLAATVFLTKDGLELAGRCDADKGTVLTLPSGTVLGHPRTRLVRAPVPSIIGVLLPAESSPQFDISTEANSVLRVLPLPPANTAGPL